MLAFFISVFKKNVGMLELTPWLLKTFAQYRCGLQQLFGLQTA
jgi:hypothetical protein